MADLFRVVFEVGSDAPVSAVASIFAGLDVMTQGAFDVAAHAAEVAALGLHEPERAVVAAPQRRPRVRVKELDPELGGEAARQPSAEEDESPAEAVTAELQALKQQLDAMQDWLAEGRISVAPLLASRRARELAVARLMPRRPYRFRSVRYQNPLAVEIVSEAGFASAALAFLLRLVRDWSSARRQSAAAAVEAESRAFLRAQLRRLVLERVADRELALTSEMVTALLSDAMVDAVDRLAAYGLDVERQELPGG